MERGVCVQDSLFGEESAEDAQDVMMLDVEDGEFTEQNSKTELREVSGVGEDHLNEESNHKNPRRKNKKKKKNKPKGSGSTIPNVSDINRFVLDICKRLREKKSYLVFNAVGCLGVSALADLVKEVYAIQACGGQKTADGKRFRTGGGILWNIIKLRDPHAYNEIMKKGKEFEKQFKQQRNIKQEQPMQQIDESSQSITFPSIDQNSHNLPDGMESTIICEKSGEKRKSVRDRMRIPVTYDDLIVGENVKAEPT